MRLQFDVSPLWAAVSQMGADKIEFSFEANIDPLDIDLQDGKEITLEDLSYEGGLLSVQGRQVLLYIADQGDNVSLVISGARSGTKVHISECRTLKKMRARKRFDRYHVTNNVSGIYNVFGTTYPSTRVIEGQVHLDICKNCLGYLNYQGYRTNKIKQSQIFSEFTLNKFFETYSTLFSSLPMSFSGDMGYSADWKVVSRQTRQEANYCCEECLVNLNSYKQLLHVHHINGVKADNRKSNLKVVCADCHRKEPNHQHMRVSAEDMRIIQNTRKATPEVAKVDGWDLALKYVDEAFFGLLDAIRGTGKACPEIGFNVTDDGGSVVGMAEVAWPAEKKAIVRNEKEAAPISAVGWKVSLCKDVLDFFDKPKPPRV